MPYSELLGRYVVAKGTEAEVEKLADQLMLSGLSASVYKEADSDLYTVSVPFSQEQKARQFLDRKICSVEKESSDLLQCQPPLARNEDKIKDTTNSATLFITAGLLVLLFAISRCILILLHYSNESPRSCMIEFGFGSVFLIFGLYTLSRAKEMQHKIQEEAVFSTKVIEWCISTYPSAQLDRVIAAATDHETLSEAKLCYLRQDLIRCYILREFNIEDPDFLEYLTAKTYISIFEKPKIQLKPRL